MDASIDLPFRPQQADGYCLASCIQMVLAYFGRDEPQATLATRLGMIENVGIPISRVTRLASSTFSIEYGSEGTFHMLAHWIGQGVPVIACVQTQELGYWQGAIAQHAVVVVGLDDRHVRVVDPAQGAPNIVVSRDEFWLAWDEMALSYVVLRPRSGGRSGEG